MEKKLHLSLLFIYFAVNNASASATPALQQLHRGFKANFDASTSSFQPLLSDQTGVFSFGFLQINSSNIDLAVVHLPSSQPVWRAIPNRPAQRSGSAFLSFNGSLLFSDEGTGDIWSTPASSGDRVLLLNSSNLQILKLAEPVAILWQSFDFPSNTIVQDQKFTSNSSLFSTNQRYSMRLGANYLALFMEFGRGNEEAMYWKRTALEAKNQIVPGDGPIYAQLNPVGFLGLYQKENEPVDELSFDSFARGITGFRRLTLESDGNLGAYYWNGTIWTTDYKAISALCELPNACGAYGLCSAGEKQCGCIDNRSNGCLTEDSGDLCGVNDDFWVLRRRGVDLANKEVIGFVKVGSLKECEGLCEKNCSCWGAVYNNGSGYCYVMDYPIQTVLGVGDESKIGYFKVRMEGNRVGGGGDKVKKITEALVVISALMAIGVAGVVVYRLWRGRRRRGVNGLMVEELEPGPYRDLGSSSFRSIEMANSFRK